MWQDEDGMVELAVHASSSGHATGVHCYLYPASLRAFGLALADYDGSVAQCARFEVGAPDAYAWLCLEALPVDNSGHSILRIATATNGAPADTARASFAAAADPAVLNRLGIALAAWAGDSDAAFDFDTSDAS
ncbi:MAG: hypothetical protein HOQ32_10020 [Lysobacter sp.]|nr:hypothetical protein [Lysobacter sp.]